MSRLPSQDFVTSRMLQAHTDDGTVRLPANFKPAEGPDVSFSYTDLPVEEFIPSDLQTAQVDGHRIGLPKSFTPAAAQPDGISISEFDAEMGGTFGERLVRSFQPRITPSPAVEIAAALLDRELQSPILEAADEHGAVRGMLRNNLDKARAVFNLRPAPAERESGLLDDVQATLVGTSTPAQLDAATWAELRDKVTEELKQYDDGDPRREAVAGLKIQLTMLAGEQQSIENIAAKRGISPEAQVKSQQPRAQGIKTLPLPVRATVTGFSDLGASAFARLVGAGVLTTDRTRDMENSKQLGQELLRSYAKNSSTAEVLGKDGAVMFDQLMQTVPKYLTVGAFTGGAGIALAVGTEGYNRRLHEADDLPESQQQAYAVLGTAAELALMRVFSMLVGGTAEEALTPAARHAARQLLKKQGFNGFLRKGVKVSVGESGEEGSITGSDRAWQVAFGLREDFSGLGAEAKSNAILGALGGAMAHTGAGVVSSIEGLRPKVRDTAEGFITAGDWFQNASRSDVENVLKAQTDEDFITASRQDGKSPFFREAFTDEVARLNEVQKAEAAKGPVHGPEEAPVQGPLTKEQAADLESLTPESDTSSPPDQSTVTARHRDLRRFRERMDFDDISETAKRTFFGTLTEARNEGIPGEAWQIASEHLIEMRPMSGKQTIGLTDRVISLDEQYLAMAERTRSSMTDEEFTANYVEMRYIEKEMDVISEALIRTGSEQGFALAARKMAQKIDRHSPSNLRKRAKKSKKGRKKRPGEPGKDQPATLTDEQSKKLSKLAKQVAEAQKKVDATEAGTREYLDASWELHKLKNTADKYLLSLRPSDTISLKNVFEIQNIWRAILTGFDGPPFLRHGYVDFMKRFSPAAIAGSALRVVGGGKGKLKQGGKGKLRGAATIAANTARATLRGRPLGVRPRASTLAFFSAFWSAKKVFQADLEQSRLPNADLHKSMELAVMAQDAPMGEREVEMMSNAADKVWVLKNFQRAFRVWMNRLRTDSFDDMVDRFGGRDNLDPNTMWHIAQYVNNATGRGGLGGFENSAHGLAQIFLAPRFFMSRMTHAVGWPVIRAAYQGDRVAAGILAGEYANFLLGMMSFISMTVLFGKLQFGEENVDFEYDPTQRNAGRLRINDRQIDITGGLARLYRILNVVGRGAYSTVTNDDITQADTGGSLAGTFSSSFAPGLSAASGLVLNKTFDGNFSPSNAINNHLWPFSAKDAVSALRDKSDLSEGGAIALAEMLGGGSFQIKGKGR